MAIRHVRILQILLPGAPLGGGGGIQFPSCTGKSCCILLLPMLLLVSLLPEPKHFLCPHQTASRQLPDSQSPTCSTANSKGSTVPQGTRAWACLCIPRPSLASVECIRSKKRFTKDTRTKEMSACARAHKMLLGSIHQDAFEQIS